MSSNYLVLLQRLIESLADAKFLIFVAVGLGLLFVASLQAGLTLTGILLLTLIALTLTLGPSISSYFLGLGNDSWSEISRIEYSEVLFYLRSVAGVLDPISGKKVLVEFAAVLVALVVLTGICNLNQVKRIYRLKFLGTAILIFSTLSGASQTMTSYRESQNEMDGIRKNYRESIESGPAIGGPLHVVVYVGESTTVMNWSLYGYFRNTTPELKRKAESDSGLLVFHDAISSHSHTTSSLLDTMGIQPTSWVSEEPRETTTKHYASLIGILRRAGVSTALLSSQARHGTWNIGSGVVFGEVDHSRYSIDASLMGNAEARLNRPFDLDYFSATWSEVWIPGKNQVLFLHSYAGHGPYLQNIPEDFRMPVDDSLAGISPDGVIGDSIALNDATLEDLQAYDSAMRYIDHSISAVIDRVSSSHEPTVLIYFSDHGESPWTGRGHDSSRFVHEMVRVPLLIFFNQAAQKSHPEQYRALKSAAKIQRPHPLSEFPGSVLSLFSIKLGQPTGRFTDASPGAGTGQIMVRTKVGDELPTAATIFGRNAPHHSRLTADSADPATAIYRVENTTPRDFESTICYHRSDNIARIRRAGIVARCIELDVAPSRRDEKVIEILHPPKTSTGLKLSLALEAFKGLGRTVWFDAKDVGSESSCRALAQAAIGWQRTGGVSLVEFASETDLTKSAASRCFADLRDAGVRVSYYVPTELAQLCTNDMARALAPTAPCSTLQARIDAIRSSGLFSDLSFDYAVAPAMRKVQGAKALRWNTWGVKITELAEVAANEYSLIIADVASDPNLY